MLRAERGTRKIRTSILTQATKSLAGRVRRNNAVYEEKWKKEKKNLTVSHTQHRASLIITPISTIGKE